MGDLSLSHYTPPPILDKKTLLLPICTPGERHWKSKINYMYLVQEHKYAIAHCKNVRGLGKSMAVFCLFEKTKIFK